MHLLAGRAAWAALVGAHCGCWRRGGISPRGGSRASILLIPSSSIFPAADLAADRRMYLPMFAFAAAARPRAGAREAGRCLPAADRRWSWRC